jgi:hypothetical protein
MEEKIYLLYNFCYNNNFNNCLEIDNIILGKIKIDDIKIIDIKEADDIIEKINESKISYINFDNVDSISHWKVFTNTSYNVRMKISTYKKGKDIDNLNSFPNNDSLFSYLLSSLVVKKKTNNILLPIINFDIEFDKIKHILKSNEMIYNEINEKIEIDEINTKLSIRIREQFFDTVTLKDYLEKNSCLYKSLLFQIIHTLAIIQKEYPKFRHNNLTIDNILLYIRKDQNNLKYEFNNKKWELNTDFEVKITNFEKATLPNLYGTLNQRDTDVPYINEVNEYFDLHTFLNSLISKINLIKGNNLSDCDLETKKFLDKIIPIKLREMKNNKFYLNKNIVLEKPSNLLNDSYFSSFILDKETSQQQTSQLGTSEIQESDYSTIVQGKSEYIKRTIKNVEVNALLKRIEEDKPRKMKGGAYENPYEVKKPESFITQDSKKAEEQNKEAEKPTTFITQDTKNVEKINNPPTDTRTLKPWEKTDYKPNFKPSYPPREDKPYPPREDKPYQPKPSYPPREDKPYTPREDKPYQPREDKPYQPREDKPYQPREDKPYQPNSDSRPSYQPNSDSRPPYKPRDDTRPPYKPSYPPRDDTRPSFKPSYPPREDKPAYPSNKPYMPKEPTVQPVEEKFDTVKKMDNVKNDIGDVPPGFIPLYDPQGSMINKMYPYNLVPMQPPINKIYNISLNDPLGNHSYINKIYEDVLPSEKTVYSFLTLKEREVIKKFLRNSILDKYDGEDFTIQGSKKSLLSWIKIYDINPYHIRANPYDDIPNGFLLYRSAYPIRYNKEDRVLKATPTSIAINIRLYKLNIGSANCYSIAKMNSNDFDVWRDIKYYHWVDSIVRKKISPNFINILLYVFDVESKIGFNKLDMIKKDKDHLGLLNHKSNEQKLKDKYKLTLEDLAYPNYNIVDGKLVKLKDFNGIQARTSRSYIPLNDKETLRMADELNRLSAATEKIADITSEISGKRDSRVKDEYLDLTKEEPKILVALTEAPNTNILKWNSKIYESTGSVRRMTSTGYHNPDVWCSILFQLIYACAILEKHQIYFENFSLENNVYIKDVQTDGTGNSCWLYKINNMEYYVPNYGYLLVIDSNYADITYDPLSKHKQFKIYGSIFDDINGNKSNFSKLVRNAVTQIIMQPENFIKDKGNELDDKVKTMLINIGSSLSGATSLIDIIPNNFRNLMHNKVGTLLSNFEKQNFSVFGKPTYKEGSLMVRQLRFDEYEWVIFKETVAGNKKVIITKDREATNEQFKEIQVFPSTLFSYFEKVLPDNVNVIETYTFE